MNSTRDHLKAVIKETRISNKQAGYLRAQVKQNQSRENLGLRDCSNFSYLCRSINRKRNDDEYTTNIKLRINVVNQFLAYFCLISYLF